MKTVLVVEDELKIARVVRDYLTDAGYDVVGLERGGRARERARLPAGPRRARPRAPRRRRVDVARELRATSHVPIVMLTARARRPTGSSGWSWGATTTW